MKTLLSKKLIIAFVAILLCITSMKAQTPTPQSKIRDYKLKHNSLQRIKQKQSVNNSAPNFNLKINPYWQDVNAPHAINNSHISQVQIPSANVVWAHIDYDTSAYVANQFIRTADFGRTWQKDSVDTPNGYGLSSIAAVDANTCYAAMYNAFNYGGSIYKTTDGGVTWKELEQGKLFTTSQSFPDMIYFFDAQHGVAVGDADDVDTTRSEIYTTSDAGKTWQRVPDKNLPPTKGYTFSDINAFTVFQNRLWFIAGDTQGNTYMYRSDDLGKHWRQFPYTLSTPIYHFAFADKQNGLGLSFDFGTGQTYEVATRDGGKTWADKSFTGYQMGFWVTVIPFTHTFVSTISGGYTPVSGCSYSNDYGATWHLIDTSSDFQPGALSFLNPFIGWCGRWDSPDPNGGMYKWKYHFSLDDNAVATNTNTSSDDAIASAKNNTTSLSAYPNPVSNSASISFDLSQTQKVSVTIYDMNGRLIKTLVDAQMEVGNHQLTWNAKSENVIAGTYLLKMQAGDKIETKKISVVR